MAMSDPFLPAQERGSEHTPVQPEDHDIEDEIESDLPVPADPGDAGEGEPPTSGDVPFRTPTGDRVDPAADA